MFGMGTGGSLSLLPPEIFRVLRASPALRPRLQNRTVSQISLFPLLLSLRFPLSFRSQSLDQAFGRLVSASSRIAALSPPTYYLIVSEGPLAFAWNLLLEVGFTLRCLQRLSLPHFASQLCHWHDNCCTRDASTPVLSY